MSKRICAPLYDDVNKKITINEVVLILYSIKQFKNFDKNNFSVGIFPQKK